MAFAKISSLLNQLAENTLAPPIAFWSITHVTVQAEKAAQSCIILKR